MSFLGVNIRKIRAVKKLSQTEFAKLFDLTRSAVGSYEEGRAEAKIDKIIEISDYFGISLDAFLKKKLTVNEILHYDKRKIEQNCHGLSVLIPFVAFSRHIQYAENYKFKDYIDRLPRISLPDVEKNWRSFEFSDKNHFLDGEILVCSIYDGHPRPNDWFLMLARDYWSVSERIISKKNFYEIWRIETIVVKSLHKIHTNVILHEILNNQKEK